MNDSEIRNLIEWLEKKGCTDSEIVEAFKALAAGNKKPMQETENNKEDEQ